MKIFASRAEKRRHYRRLRIQFYCFAGAVLLALVFIIYGALNFSFLKIKTTQITGVAKLEDIRPAVLRGTLAQFLGLNNFLSWPGKISGIRIEKDYSTSVLTIVGAVPERFAIWCARSCYWINRDGIAIEEAPDTEGGAIAKINDAHDFTPVAGKLVLERFFANLAGILDGLNGLPIAIANFSYNDRLEELTAAGARGEKLIFSVRFAPSEKMFASLQQLIVSGRVWSAEYADLTVENRIYLK